MTVRANHTVPGRAPRRRAPLELQCPECANPVRVARDELIEGAPIQCRHCGLEAELRADYDVYAHKNVWFLVDPLAEREEEERRS